MYICAETNHGISYEQIILAEKGAWSKGLSEHNDDFLQAIMYMKTQQ